MSDNSQELVEIKIVDNTQLKKINFENIFYSEDCDGVMEVKLFRALLTTYLEEGDIENFIKELDVTDNITLLIVMRYLRGEKKFNGVNELKTQINLDIKESEKYFEELCR